MARSTIVRARNDTGTTLAAGTIVYISGYNEVSQIPTIAPADNRYEDKIPAIGAIRADIENGETDVVKINGPVESFDTSGAIVNDNVYVGENGAITFVDPSEINENNLTQQIGTVQIVDDYPNGRIFLFPLEIGKKVSHPDLKDVLEDQHHVKFHAGSHRPNGIDKFIHAGQHEFGGGDPIRHDRLTNLNEDVHPIYALLDGTRAFTGTVQIDNDGRLILSQVNDASSPTIQFGSTGTGLYASAAGALNISISGGNKVFISSAQMRSTTSGAWNLLNEAASSINPVFAFQSDASSGMGLNATGQLSLIANSVEGIRISESSGIITTTFTDNIDFVDDGYMMTHEGEIEIAPAKNLRITTTTGALILPRLTNTERNNIVGENGAMIYNLSANNTQVYQNGSWEDVAFA